MGLTLGTAQRASRRESEGQEAACFKRALAGGRAGERQHSSRVDGSGAAARGVSGDFYLTAAHAGSRGQRGPVQDGDGRVGGCSARAVYPTQHCGEGGREGGRAACFGAGWRWRWRWRWQQTELCAAEIAQRGREQCCEDKGEPTYLDASSFHHQLRRAACGGRGCGCDVRLCARVSAVCRLSYCIRWFRQSAAQHAPVLRQWRRIASSRLRYPAAAKAQAHVRRGDDGAVLVAVGSVLAMQLHSTLR